MLHAFLVSSRTWVFGLNNSEALKKETSKLVQARLFRNPTLQWHCRILPRSQALSWCAVQTEGGTDSGTAFNLGQVSQAITITANPSPKATIPGSLDAPSAAWLATARRSSSVHSGCVSCDSAIAASYASPQFNDICCRATANGPIGPRTIPVNAQGKEAPIRPEICPGMVCWYPAIGRWNSGQLNIRVINIDALIHIAAYSANHATYTARPPSHSRKLRNAFIGLVRELSKNSKQNKNDRTRKTMAKSKIIDTLSIHWRR